MRITIRNHRGSICKVLLPFVGYVFLVFFELNAQSASDDNEAPGTENVEQEQGTIEIPTDEATVAHGRQLFSQHCMICHQIGQQVIGPALASVHQRRPIPWLMMFIKNSQNVIINQDDEYAQQLFEQYNRQVMPPFEFLSNDDILAILAYIQAESSSETSYGGVNGASSAQTDNPNQEGSDNVGAEAYSQKNDSERNPEDVSTGISGSLIFGILVGMLILITIIFVVARRSTKSARKA